jgi:hypothetical protein
MFYRSNTLRVLCPEITIATFSGMPLRIMFLIPVSPEIVEQQPLVFPLAPTRLAFRLRHSPANPATD